MIAMPDWSKELAPVFQLSSATCLGRIVLCSLVSGTYHSLKTVCSPLQSHSSADSFDCGQSKAQKVVGLESSRRCACNFVLVRSPTCSFSKLKEFSCSLRRRLLRGSASNQEEFCTKVWYSDNLRPERRSTIL